MFTTKNEGDIISVKGICPICRIGEVKIVYNKNNSSTIEELFCANQNHLFKLKLKVDYSLFNSHKIRFICRYKDFLFHEFEDAVVYWLDNTLSDNYITSWIDYNDPKFVDYLDYCLLF